MSFKLILIGQQYKPIRMRQIKTVKERGFWLSIWNSSLVFYFLFLSIFHRLLFLEKPFLDPYISYSDGPYRSSSAGLTRLSHLDKVVSQGWWILNWISISCWWSSLSFAWILLLNCKQLGQFPFSISSFRSRRNSFQSLNIFLWKCTLTVKWNF